MGDEDTNSLDSQVLELRQKLSMAHEELESVRREAEKLLKRKHRMLARRNRRLESVKHEWLNWSKSWSVLTNA